jgi:hypothetical protein
MPKYDGASEKENGYVSKTENHPRSVNPGGSIGKIAGYVAEKVFPNKNPMMGSKKSEAIREIEDDKRR